MSGEGFDVNSDEGFQVALPSGAPFVVMTEGEEAFVNDRVTRYMNDNHFVNISDLADVDKMIIAELFMHRWGQWMSKGLDYWNEPQDTKILSRQYSEVSTELRQLKKSLGVDKVSRDRQRGDDSVHAYLDKLRVRAGEFGVKRNMEAAKSIELFKQLQALITVYDNSDDIERVESQVTQQDIFDWIRTTAIPEMEAIDDAFRQNQKTWVREM